MTRNDRRLDLCGEESVGKRRRAAVGDRVHPAGRESLSRRSGIASSAAHSGSTRRIEESSAESGFGVPGVRSLLVGGDIRRDRWIP